tara:strand:- start:4318 stop:5271 length:954 start_codon:yes stop_codon:yes gene_type:complete
MSEVIDIQGLRDVLVLTNKYFEINRNNLKKAEELLEQMSSKSLDSINNGVDLTDIRFTHDELYGLAWSSSSDPDKPAATIRKYRPQLINLLDEDSNLSKYLIESGSKHLLSFDSDDVKGGVKTTHGLTLKTSSHITSHNVSSITIYKTVKIPKPNWWMKGLMKVELEGRNAFWFFSVAVICVCSLALIPYIILKGLVSGITAGLTIGVILAASIGLFYQMYELMEKGVSKAPDIFTPFRIKNLFFVTTRKPKFNSDALRPKVIELLVFEGRCGLCGDELFIEKSREFKGRYVGKCAIAPQEHVFSFDHINKIGQHLR